VSAGSDLCWVTGASGFLGRHVSRVLAQRGCKVVGIARRNVSEESAAVWGFYAIESGPFEGALLRRVLTTFGPPKVIFHSIGSGTVSQAAADPAGDAERTIGSLQKLEGVLAELGSEVRFIYPSSAAVYGNLKDDYATGEGIHTHPVSIYGENKLSAEEWCLRRAQEDDTDVVILRLFSVFGSPQRKLLFWDIGRQIMRGIDPITLGGTGSETRDFIHVTDAAAAIALVAESRNVAQVVNIGTGKAVTIKTAARSMAAAMGGRCSIEFSGITRPGDPVHQRADIARLRSLGFVPQTEFVMGVGEYAQWLQRSDDAIDEATRIH
jgi:UDP-glucose 4-epimerase